MKLRALIMLLVMPVVLAAATASQGFAQTGAQNGAQAPAPHNAQNTSKQPGASRGERGGERLSLTPHYVDGQVIRYQFENTMTSAERRGGAVSDPQGGGKLTLRWSAIVRMEVLSIGKDAKGQPDGSVRMRSVYEKSAASTDSDTYDPATDAMQAQYGALEGKTFEFTVDAAGHMTDIKGFDDADVQGRADAMRDSLGQFSTGLGAPRGGVAVGETWTAEQPFESAPLAGLVWKIHSTYLRNEPCHPANPEGEQNPAAGEMCAVILTKQDLTGSRAGHDATPDSYRKQGLKTEGTMNATGDSLSYITLKDGQLVSLTQTSSEQMDFTVSSQDGENRKLFQGTVQSRTQLALMPPSKQ
jgi:hypothetical protein